MSLFEFRLLSGAISMRQRHRITLTAERTPPTIGTRQRHRITLTVEHTRPQCFECPRGSTTRCTLDEQEQSSTAAVNSLKVGGVADPVVEVVVIIIN